MSNTANTFTSVQGMLHEAYSDGVGSHNHPKKKSFKKIKDKVKTKKCKCSDKCGCKK
jgi:hypothetical protein